MSWQEPSRLDICISAPSFCRSFIFVVLCILPDSHQAFFPSFLLFLVGAFCNVVALQSRSLAAPGCSFLLLSEVWLAPSSSRAPDEQKYPKYFVIAQNTTQGTSPRTLPCASCKVMGSAIKSIFNYHCIFVITIVMHGCRSSFFP